MTVWRQTQGHMVNRKRVQHLMPRRGLAAIDPRPRSNRPAPEHRIYHSSRGLPDCSGGVGHGDSVSVVWALVRRWEPTAPMQREKSKWRIH